MILYLDTSALVKLYVDEEHHETVHNSVAESEAVATSLVAFVEARRVVRAPTARRAPRRKRV